MADCTHQWIPYLHTPNAVMCKSCGARGTVTIDYSYTPSHLERARENHAEALLATERGSPGYLARLEGAIGHILCHLEEKE